MESKIATSTVLDLAADAIQMGGWAQGYGWGHGLPGEPSGLCLEGGIAAVVDAERTPGGLVDSTKLKTCPAYVAVKDYLDIRNSLWVWNDAEGRTAGEVIEVLRAAAAVERLKESTPAVYETEDQPLPIKVAA